MITFFFNGEWLGLYNTEGRCIGVRRYPFMPCHTCAGSPCVWCGRVRVGP